MHGMPVSSRPSFRVERCTTEQVVRGYWRGALLFALGIHGQYVFVDRRNQLVIVMMSSQADPLDAELISLTMTAVSHFREIFALSQ